MSTPPPSSTRDRRGALKILIGWLTAAMGAVVGIPGLAFLASPLRRETASGSKTPLRVASLVALSPGQPVRFDVRGQLVDAWNRVPDVKLGSCWLVKAEADARVRAFSTVCPHLGCGIEWNGPERCFGCPCHQSVFSREGKVISGPSPRDMDELEVVSDGVEVKVVYRRFRVGTSKKVEV